MTKLDEGQLGFLNHHNIPIDRVLWVEGMASKVWKSQMKSEGFMLAAGGAPCQKAGHRLRTRAGHCVQCDTSKIAYALRAYSVGHVYVLSSNSAQLTKIGVTADINARLANLKSQSYGGQSDWKAEYVAPKTSNAGRIEIEVKKALREFSTKAGVSTREGSTQESTECFSCSAAHAVSVLKAIVDEIS